MGSFPSSTSKNILNTQFKPTQISKNLPFSSIPSYRIHTVRLGNSIQKQNKIPLAPTPLEFHRDSNGRPAETAEIPPDDVHPPTSLPSSPSFYSNDHFPIKPGDFPFSPTLPPISHSPSSSPDEHVYKSRVHLAADEYSTPRSTHKPNQARGSDED